MTISEVKILIDKQAAINIAATEDYDREGCEIIVYDAILDFCIQNQYCIGSFELQVLISGHSNYGDENWMVIASLFAEYVSEEKMPEVDDKVLELLNYYYDRFWK